MLGFNVPEALITNKINAVNYLCDLKNMFKQGPVAFKSCIVFSKLLIYKYGITKKDLSDQLKVNEEYIVPWLAFSDGVRTNDRVAFYKRGKTYFLDVIVSDNRVNLFSSKKSYDVCSEYIFNQLHLEQSDDYVLKYLLVKYEKNIYKAVKEKNEDLLS